MINDPVNKRYHNGRIDLVPRISPTAFAKDVNLIDTRIGWIHFHADIVKFGDHAEEGIGVSGFYLFCCSNRSLKHGLVYECLAFNRYNGDASRDRRSGINRQIDFPENSEILIFNIEPYR